MSIGGLQPKTFYIGKEEFGFYAIYDFTTYCPFGPSTESADEQLNVT
jgi:uncharacterized protein YwgA